MVCVVYSVYDYELDSPMALYGGVPLLLELSLSVALPLAREDLERLGGVQAGGVEGGGVEGGGGVNGLVRPVVS